MERCYPNSSAGRLSSHPACLSACLAVGYSDSYWKSRANSYRDSHSESDSDAYCKSGLARRRQSDASLVRL